jgi:hypothetical protein
MLFRPNVDLSCIWYDLVDVERLKILFEEWD